MEAGAWTAWTVDHDGGCLRLKLVLHSTSSMVEPILATGTSTGIRVEIARRRARDRRSRQIFKPHRAPKSPPTACLYFGYPVAGREMSAHEPALQLVGSYYLTDDKVVGPFVATLSCFAGESPRFLE